MMEGNVLIQGHMEEAVFELKGGRGNQEFLIHIEVYTLFTVDTASLLLPRCFFLSLTRTDILKYKYFALGMMHQMACF